MRNGQFPEAGFRRLIGDIVDLCELQWQLLTVDGEEAKRRAVTSALLIGIASVLALAAVTGIVISLSWLLHEQYGFSRAASFGIVGGAALLLSLLTLLSGAKMLSRAADSLSETKREFSENVRWIKSVILSPHSTPRYQLRRESFPPEPPVDPRVHQRT